MESRERGEEETPSDKERQSREQLARRGDMTDRDAKVHLRIVRPEPDEYLCGSSSHG